MSVLWEVPAAPAGPIGGYTVQMTEKNTKETLKFEVDEAAFEHQVKNCTE